MNTLEQLTHHKDEYNKYMELYIKEHTLNLDMTDHDYCISAYLGSSRIAKLNRCGVLEVDISSETLDMLSVWRELKHPTSTRQVVGFSITPEYMLEDVDGALIFNFNTLTPSNYCKSASVQVLTGTNTPSVKYINHYK